MWRWTGSQTALAASPTVALGTLIATRRARSTHLLRFCWWLQAFCTILLWGRRACVVIVAAATTAAVAAAATFTAIAATVAAPALAAAFSGLTAVGACVQDALLATHDESATATTAAVHFKREQWRRRTRQAAQMVVVASAGAAVPVQERGAVAGWGEGSLARR